MSSQAERERGDKWALGLEARGWWVQKMPASSMAGCPDWLVGKDGAKGSRWVEAKTLEAVLGARGHAPARACTGAQRFFLDRAHRSGDGCSVLIVGPVSYLEVRWVDAELGLSLAAFVAAALPYQ